MAISPLAGKPVPTELLVDLSRLEREYYAHEPDVANPAAIVHEAQAMVSRSLGR